jgi:hypothetical protein
MADTTEEFLNGLVRDVDELLAKADQKKQLINQICADRGLPARYSDVGGGRPTSLGVGSIRRDQFHGRKMATAIREYLQLRGASDRGGLGAANINEIYAALLEGGFTFDTKNDLNAKRGLRDALSKNTLAFHRVGDSYGLTEWYPKPPRPEKPAKKARRKAKKKAKAKTPAKAAAAGDNVVDLKPAARQPRKPAMPAAGSGGAA